MTPADVRHEVSERQAREVAEAARQTEWTRPSFAKELYLGKFDLPLIHPHPRGEGAAVADGDAFISKLEEFCRTLDGRKIERDSALAEGVKTRDREINRMEVAIDGACRRIEGLVRWRWRETPPFDRRARVPTGRRGPGRPRRTDPRDPWPAPSRGPRRAAASLQPYPP